MGKTLPMPAPLPQLPPRQQEPPATSHRPLPLSRSAEAGTTDALLPPSSGGGGAPAPRRSDASDLLPPGVAGGAASGERKPLPAAIPSRTRDNVLIPTAQGYVGVHEPVKTVLRHGQEVELRKLSPEEKARRRTVRNTILFVFCIVTLVVVAALFMWK
jgi:hypothetical protein